MATPRLKGVDAFLAARRSRGPHEPAAPGTEFTIYDAPDLDVKVFVALLKASAPLRRVVAVARFTLETRWSPTHGAWPMHLRVAGGVLVTDAETRTPRLWLPRELGRRIAETRTRFVVCNLGIYAGRDLCNGHANALLFDAQRRVVERYEPCGEARGAALDLLFARTMRRRLPDWDYEGSRGTANAQMTQDSFDGMCVTFCLLYTLLRVSNPAHPPARIRAHLARMQARGVLGDAALRLNAFAIDLLRRHRRGTLSPGDGRADGLRRSPQRSKKKWDTVLP